MAEQLASYLFTPRRRRTESRGGYVGVDVEAGGKLYRGGYVHGPLSGSELADLILAGYGDRIVEVPAGDRRPSRHPEDVDV